MLKAVFVSNLMINISQYIWNVAWIPMLIYIYIYIYINFVSHVQMSKYMYKKQDIYLFKSYTWVSSKASKAQ